MRSLTEEVERRDAAAMAAAEAQRLADAAAAEAMKTVMGERMLVKEELCRLQERVRAGVELVRCVYVCVCVCVCVCHFCVGDTECLCERELVRVNERERETERERKSERKGDRETCVCALSHAHAAGSRGEGTKPQALSRECPHPFPPSTTGGF